MKPYSLASAMRLVRLLATFTFGLAWFATSVPLAFADTTTYQPGPSQGKDVRVEVTQNSSGGTIVSPKDDFLLQVGTDPSKIHGSLIDMNLTGLPPKATRVVLSMVSVQTNTNVLPTDYYIYLAASSWSEQGMTTLPTVYTPPTSVSAPPLWSWINFNITGLYNARQAGTTNYRGLFFWPKTWNNQITQFLSSDYSADPRYRPKLTITSFSLKFPLATGYNQSSISSDFGAHWESSFSEDGKFKLLHTAIDIPASVGTLVYAPERGVVKYAATNTNWGGYIVIEHTANDGKKFMTICTHVTPTVGTGASVQRGQQIGKIAKPAIHGPHLHLAFIDQAYDPSQLTWILRGRLPAQSAYVVDTNGNRAYEPGFPYFFVDPKLINWTN